MTATLCLNFVLLPELKSDFLSLINHCTWLAKMLSARALFRWEMMAFILS